MDPLSLIRSQREKARLKLAKMDEVRAKLAAEIADYDAAERVLLRIGEGFTEAYTDNGEDEPSVRPKIKDMIWEAVRAAQRNGASIEDIIAFANNGYGVILNRNSIPGTLSRFKAEGRVEQRDGRWFVASVPEQVTDVAQGASDSNDVFG